MTPVVTIVHRIAPVMHMHPVHTAPIQPPAAVMQPAHAPGLVTMPILKASRPINEILYHFCVR